MNIDYYNEITKRYGNIKRCRGYYIYTSKSVRLIDMYLDGGLSLIGRKAGQLNLVLKQILDKGLMCKMPTQADLQLKKILNSFFPNHLEFRLYNTAEKAFKTCSDILKKLKIDEDFTTENLLWRFFEINSNEQILKLPCFLIKPTFPCDLGLMVFNPNIVDFLVEQSDKIFASNIFALTRSLYDIKYESDKINTLLSNGLPSGIEKIWNSNGLYLFSKLTDDAYIDIFMQALENHILISPNPEEPSVFPCLQSYSEINKFLKLL